MLSERQKKLLKIIVEHYIRTAEPVSSKAVCKKLNCSSATIRSEMANLEHKGLLVKEHISSGRIPSDAGYNYYIDNLLDPKKISGEDMLKLQVIFKNSLTTTKVIDKSLEIISDLTNLTALKLGTKAKDNNLREVRSITLDNDNVIVIIITDKGYVENRTIYLPNISKEDINNTIKLINNLISGTPLLKVNEKLDFEVKPIIGAYVKEYQMMYKTFYDVFEDINKSEYNIWGENELIKLPEFKNENKEIYDILQTLEDENYIKSFKHSKKGDDEIEVYLGEETDISDDLTIIKTGYKTRDEEGILALVGPKRMDYERIMSILKYLKEVLEEYNDG